MALNPVLFCSGVIIYTVSLTKPATKLRMNNINDCVNINFLFDDYTDNMFILLTRQTMKIWIIIMYTGYM